MAERVRRWSTGLLLLACAGLGTAVALQLSEGMPLAPTVTAAPPDGDPLEVAAEPVTFAPPPRRAFRAIAQRPLFAPTREPWQPPVEKVEAPPEVEAPPPAPPLVLVGIMLTGRTRAALLQSDDQAQPAWVREGEEWAGWRLDLVEQDRVHVQAGERAEVVELRTDAKVSGAPRPRPKAKSRRKRKGESPQGESPEDQEPVPKS